MHKRVPSLFIGLSYLIAVLFLVTLAAAEPAVDNLPLIVEQITSEYRLTLFVSDAALLRYKEADATFDSHTRTVLQSVSSKMHARPATAPTATKLTMESMRRCEDHQTQTLRTTASYLSGPDSASGRTVFFGTVVGIKYGYSGMSLNLSRGRLIALQVERQWPKRDASEKPQRGPSLMLNVTGSVKNITVSGKGLVGINTECFFFASKITGSSPPVFTAYPIACIVDDTAILYLETEDRCSMPIAEMNSVLNQGIKSP